MGMQPEELLEKITQLLGEHQTQTEAKLSQAVTELTGGDEPAEAYVAKLAEALDGILTTRHPGGMCEKDDCQLCIEQRQTITLDVLARIEERVPGTREAIANYELRNTPIEVTAK